MKLATNTVENTSNLDVDEIIEMKMDPSASGIILDSLIKIYTRPLEAALREYSSNAIDAHREAGQSRPIEITLPSALSPTLVIEDFGTGMDRATFRLYTQFGWSTKRDSNDAIGGFGLGSKVGLAFCSQYTVETTRDGVKLIAIIGRDNNGNPEAKIITEMEVEDQPNGTRIVLPSTDTRSLREAIENGFFMGMEPNTVKVDGKLISRGDTIYTKKSEKIDGVGRFLSERYENFAFLSGVRYDIDWNSVENLPDGFNSLFRNGYLRGLMVELENGEVDIARSRDTLIYSKRTQNALRAAAKIIADGAAERAQEGMKDTFTFPEALAYAYSQYQRGIASGSLVWQGLNITTSFDQFVKGKAPSDQTPTKSSYQAYTAQHRTYSYSDPYTNWSTAGIGETLRLDQLISRRADAPRLLITDIKAEHLGKDRYGGEEMSSRIRRAYGLFAGTGKDSEFHSAYFVEFSKDDIDPKFHYLYNFVTIDEYLDVVKQVRADRALAARQARLAGQAPATVKAIKVRTATRAASHQYDPFRSVRWTLSKDEVEMGKLDLSRNYLLLRRDTDKSVIDGFYASYNEDPRIRWAALADVTVLVLNKSFKDKDIPDGLQVVQLDDLEQMGLDVVKAEMAKMTVDHYTNEYVYRNAALPAHLKRMLSKKLIVAKSTIAWAEKIVASDSDQMKLTPILRSYISAYASKYSIGALDAVEKLAGYKEATLRAVASTNDYPILTRLYDGEVEVKDMANYVNGMDLILGKK